MFMYVYLLPVVVLMQWRQIIITARPITVAQWWHHASSGSPYFSTNLIQACWPAAANNRLLGEYLFNADMPMSVW